MSQMSLAILRFPSFFKAFFRRPFQDLPSQAYVRWYQTSSAVLRATAPVTSSDAGRSDLEHLSGAAQGCLGPKGTDINAPNRNVSDSVSANLRACYATMRTRPEDWPHVTLGLLERPGSLTSVHIWETGHGSIKSLLLRRFKVFEKWIEVREILEKSFSLYSVCIRTDANLQSTRPERRLPSSTRQSLVLTIQERSERDHRDIDVRCQIFESDVSSILNISWIFFDIFFHTLTTFTTFTTFTIFTIWTIFATCSGGVVQGHWFPNHQRGQPSRLLVEATQSAGCDAETEQEGVNEGWIMFNSCPQAAFLQSPPFLLFLQRCGIPASCMQFIPAWFCLILFALGKAGGPARGFYVPVPWHCLDARDCTYPFLLSCRGCQQQQCHGSFHLDSSLNILEILLVGHNGHRWYNTTVINSPFLPGVSSLPEVGDWTGMVWHGVAWSKALRPDEKAEPSPLVRPFARSSANCWRRQTTAKAMAMADHCGRTSNIFSVNFFPAGFHWILLDCHCFQALHSNWWPTSTFSLRLGISLKVSAYIL